MINFFRFSIGAALLLFVLIACDPAKNSAVNRFYHSTTSHYNGYFNANLLLDQALSDYRRNVVEDYYTLLPLQNYPDTGAVKNLYPAIDTAIAKCTKVIQNHSMPGSARPSRKKEENNNYIDENWTTVGRASYIRRDYEQAMKNFMFIKKFYTNDESNFVGELWMAKTNLVLGKYTEAGFNLDILDQALISEKEAAKQKMFKNFIKNLKKFKKEKEKEDELATLPKEIYPEMYLTKAELNLIRGEKEEAIINLNLAARHIRRKADKARVYFILGQLNEDGGNAPAAIANYTRVLQSSAPYEMAFSARLKRAFLGGSDKLIKDLNKMLDDPKNAEFKDQIYYALANIELSKGNEPQAVHYLTEAAFYSTTNSRQKGMAYEKMGDLRFAKKDYIPAQKYYDSCGRVINDKYPNAGAIRNKAAKLSELVQAVELAQFEDSVQRIAAMSESDQLTYLEEVGKTLKAREDEYKKREAEKLIALQKNQNAFNQNQSGSKFIFTNAKARAEGFEDFKRLWGDRTNEDDWRRSDKIVIATFTDENGKEVPVGSIEVLDEYTDPYSIEALSKNIPKGDSSILASQNRLVKSRYAAGIIYKDQLNEAELATDQFTAVVEKDFETDYKAMSAFQMYRMNETSNRSKADVHKSYILNYYPNSDYACYLRDPDCFVKKKEYEVKAQRDYVYTLSRYSQGLYYPALISAEEVLLNEPENEYRSKYMLLKAMCQGKLNPEKTTLLPNLNLIVKEFPKTPEAIRAKEMIDIIKNGFSKFEPVDLTENPLFTYDDQLEHYVLIFIPKGDNSSLSKNKIVDFNKEFYSRAKLRVSSKIFGDVQSIVVIDKFENDLEAKEYIRTFKATRKHLMDLQGAKTTLITQPNLKTLFETQKLREYEMFCEEYY
ncbi:hypothetical protein N8328_03215 [Crocinitomicaceae bacterium]|nr:hypothetical protein [Crocinitomicaceae bacterium]